MQINIKMDDNYLRKELYGLIKADASIFDFIQDSILDGMWYWNLEKPENEWMSPRFAKVLGYSPDEISHNPSVWQEIINQDDLKVAIENFHRHCVNPNYPYDQKVRYFHKNGHTVWIHCRGRAIRDQNGKLIRVLGVHQNTSDVIEVSERELITSQSNQERYEVLFENMSSGCSVWKKVDNDFVIVAYNKTGLKMDNLVRDDMIGRKLSEVSPDPVEKLDALKRFDRVLQTGKAELVPKISYQIKDYEVVRSNYFYKLLADEVACIFHDITEETKAEEELLNTKEEVEESRQRLMLATNSAQLGIWDWDVTNNILIWDDRMFELFGQKKAIVGNNFELWSNCLHPDDREKAIVEVNQALQGVKEFNTTFRIIHPNGDILYIKSGGLVLRDAEGNAKRMIGINRDITEVKTKENELKNAKEEAEYIALELKEAQKIASLASWYLDVATNQVTWSEELYKMYGFDASLPPPPYNEQMKIFTPESWDILTRELAKTLEKGIPYELELNFVRSDQSNGWMWVRGEAVFDIDKQIIGLRGVAQDITQHKLVQEKLRKNTVRLDESQRVAGMGDFSWDLETGNVIWSQGMHQLLGYNKSEKFDYNRINTEIHHPDDLERVTNWLNTCIESGKSTHEPNEYRLIRNDGSVLNVQTSVSVKYENDKPIEVIGTCFNITQLKLAEESLAKQSKMRQILMELASEFINVPLDEISDVINSGLANIGRSSNIDRAYIFEYDWENMMSKNTYEWCAPGIMPEIENLQAVPVDAIPQWVKTHKKGEKMVIPDTTAAFVEDGLKEILLPQGIKSIITLPMMIDEECIGFVGFDSVRQHKLYSESEEDLLLVFSQMLVNVIRRKKAEQKLINSEIKLLEAKEKAEVVALDLKESQKVASLGSWSLNILTNEVTWSEELFNIYGFSPDEDVPNFPEFENLSTPESWQNITQHLEKAIKTGEIYELEFEFKRKDGSIGWMWAIGDVVYNDNQQVIGVRGVAQDITKRKRLELELINAKEKTEESEEILKKIAENFPNSYVSVIEKDLTASFVSGAELANQNLNAQDYVGVKIEDIFGDYAQYIGEIYQQTFRGEETQNELQFGDQYLLYKTVPLIDEKGNISKILVVSENISERKERELEFQRAKLEAEKREFELTESQKIAKIGSWYYDICTDKAIWSIELYNMYGFDPTKPLLNYSKMGNLYTPESWDTLSKTVEKTLETGLPYALELEFIRADKSKGWMWAKGVPVYNNKKQIIALRGIVQDITERKYIEDNLSKQSKMRQVLMELASAFINVPLQAVSNAIDNALANIGSFFKVDRTYIIEYDWQNRVATNTHEWCADGISSEMHNMQAVPFEAIHQWVSLHEKGEKWGIPDTFSMEDTDEFKEMLQAQGIKSLTTIPMMIGEKCIGCVGFDSVRQHKVYSESEEDLLLVFSQMLVNVTERQRNEEELINSETNLVRAKEKAEESDRLKTEFIHNMSHEIRTPMNGILGFTNLLNDDDLSPEKRKHYTSIIQNSGNQLLRIIDDILEISKLETKQVKVIEEEVCLNDVLIEHFSVFDIKAKENKTPLYFKKGLSDSASTILTDASKLNKILSNLLENAIKYTHEGFIEFGYQKKGKILELYVKDTGIGIREGMQEKIFERFSQEEKELSKSVGGLGLGLSIAKENAELLGGEITLFSEKGKGTTFFVTIPYKQVSNKTTNQMSNSEENTQNMHTILIAEDEEINFFLLEVLLGKQPDFEIKVLHAKNGKEAVEICQINNEIHLVLMDIKMPVMSGYEATENIKILRPNLPVVAQTAYTSEEDREKAFASGCDDFISKPISKDVLNKMLNKYLVKK